MLLSLRSDGTYNTYIISYNINENEKQLLLDGKPINGLNNKVTVTPINDQGLSNNIFQRVDDPEKCWGWVEITPTCSFSEQHTAEQIREGANCKQINNGGFVSQSYSVLMETECPYPSGGYDFSDPDEGDPNSSGGAASGNGSSSGDNDDDCDDPLSTRFEDDNGGCIPNTSLPVDKGEVDDNCEETNFEPNTLSNDLINNSSQESLELMLNEELPITASTTQYKNHIQAVGQYFSNLSNDINTNTALTFKPVKDVLVDASNNETLDLNYYAYIYQKSKQIWDILSEHSLELATLGDLDNLDQILSLSELTIVENNLLEISMISSLKELYEDYWPQTTEEWEEFGEFVGTVLQELVPELIPGVSEALALKSAITNFTNQNYFDGAGDLTIAIVGIFPVGKAIKAIAKFAKGFKVITRLTKSYRKAKNMVSAAINGNTTNALNKFKEIGCQLGGNSRIRTVTNASEAQGKSFFDLLTKNGTDISSQIPNLPDGMIVKEMSDGSKIKFRPFDTQSPLSNQATIEFEGGAFTGIIERLKFDGN